MTKKPFLLFLVVLLLIIFALYWQPILQAFAGMTIFEAIRQIVTFIVHVVVWTILGYAAYTLVEFIGPLAKLGRSFLRKQRQLRKRVRVVDHKVVPAQRQGDPVRPRSSKDMALYWAISQLARRGAQRSQRRDPQSQAKDRPRLRF